MNTFPTTTIDGKEYRSVADFTDAFAPDYNAGDWAEIATYTDAEIDAGNRAAFPGMSDADYAAMNMATRFVADQYAM